MWFSAAAIRQADLRRGWAASLRTTCGRTAEQINITPARRNRIAVVQIDTPKREQQ